MATSEGDKNVIDCAKSILERGQGDDNPETYQSRLENMLGRLVEQLGARTPVNVTVDKGTYDGAYAILKCPCDVVLPLEAAAAVFSNLGGGVPVTWDWGSSAYAYKHQSDREGISLQLFTVEDFAKLALSGD